MSIKLIIIFRNIWKCIQLTQNFDVDFFYIIYVRLNIQDRYFVYIITLWILLKISYWLFKWNITNFQKNNYLYLLERLSKVIFIYVSDISFSLLIHLLSKHYFEHIIKYMRFSQSWENNDRIHCKIMFGNFGIKKFNYIFF